jgi:hypothetical protein
MHVPQGFLLLWFDQVVTAPCIDPVQVQRLVDAQPAIGKSYAKARSARIRK